VVRQTLPLLTLAPSKACVGPSEPLEPAVYPRYFPLPSGEGLPPPGGARTLSAAVHNFREEP
jgi:hypothetical protein